ncbi:MAG TPA: PAS domain-containing protein, partial [Thermoanaerobaculia bacterium]|nr:PAS domain-containing protein [Thermoanaerobaculia bacterium]
MASHETVDEFSSWRSLQSALDAGHIGTWVWDIVHDRIDWSHGFEIAHGFVPGTLPQSLEAYQQRMHPDDRARIVAALRSSASGGTPYSVEYRLIDLSGRVHYVEAHGQAVRDANGSITGMVGVCTDVSERRELLERERDARIAAERSKAQYRSLAEAIPQQVWTATPDGNLDFVNQRVLDYFQRSFDAMIGEGWQNVVHAEDLPGVIEKWTNSLSTGRPYEVEFRLLRTDGVYRWHLGRAIPIRDNSGAIIKWLGTNTDIDDQKTARDLMAAQIEITRLLMNARAIDSVAPAMLESICRNLYWSCAQLWIVDRSAAVLRRSAGWCNPSMQHGDFELLAGFDSMHRGEGLPGRIWASKDPAWIDNLQTDENFPRAQTVRRIGLRSAFGFPLIVNGEVSAVIELFSSETRPVNQATLDVAHTLGGMIGQF